MQNEIVHPETGNQEWSVGTHHRRRHPDRDRVGVACGEPGLRPHRYRTDTHLGRCAGRLPDRALVWTAAQRQGHSQVVAPDVRT